VLVLGRERRLDRPEVWQRITDIAWAICGLWTLAVLVEFNLSLNLKAPSEDQVLRGIRAAVDIPAGYVIARAIHGVARVRQRG
jgi:hypothetical protein